MRDFYKVLLVGAAGRGKTYSFRNMDRNSTAFINVEDKPLPFKNGFCFHERPKSPADVKAALQRAATDPTITAIAFDSLSSFMEMLLAECRAKYKGFEVWNEYNTRLGKFFNFVKSIQKEVFITAHYELITDEAEGVVEKRVKTKGKEWEGCVEKEFTMVLYATSKASEGKLPEHYFTLVNQGKDSTKCPPDIFGASVMKVENDSKIVLDKILEFVA